MIRCHYTDGPHGQLHWREWEPPEEIERPLLCLHPAPFSGLFFTAAMPLLGARRAVISPDYPGYGGSAPAGEEPTIADYAAAMIDLLESLKLGRVDVLGFHTGCLVGAEMALLAPEHMRRLVLVDVPYFTGGVQQGMLERAAQPLQLSGDAQSIAPLWDSGVGGKAEIMGLSRAVEMLTEQLRVYPRAHSAFHAAFTWPCEERMSALRVPVRVIATQSGLLDATRDCARVIPGALLEERLDITRGVFESGAADIAESVEQALA